MGGGEVGRGGGAGGSGAGGAGGAGWMCMEKGSFCENSKKKNFFWGEGGGGGSGVGLGWVRVDGNRDVKLV